MLLSPLELLMPAVMLILIFLPLIKVIRGKTSLRSAKIRLASHICMFFGIAIGFVIFSMYKVQAAEAVDTASQMNGSIAQGLGFLPQRWQPASLHWVPASPSPLLLRQPSAPSLKTKRTSVRP